jgi:hypothetical protein
MPPLPPVGGGGLSLAQPITATVVANIAVKSNRAAKSLCTFIIPHPVLAPSRLSESLHFPRKHKGLSLKNAFNNISHRGAKSARHFVDFATRMRQR